MAATRLPSFISLPRPTEAHASDRAYCTHIVVPALLFGAAMMWLLGLHGDLWIADHLFAWQGHAWSLRQGWFTEALVHKLGKRLSTLAWLGVAGLFVASYFKPALRRWRWPLLYLLGAVAVSTGVVSTLKHITDMDCPWDLQRYGGLQPYVDLFTARPVGLPRGQCFPAGHASAGYAWVALYFFLLAVKPQWRRLGLAASLLVGALFGVSQQLRGAHFMSHDLVTAAICWTVALIGYGLLQRRLGNPAADALASADKKAHMSKQVSGKHHV